MFDFFKKRKPISVIYVGKKSNKLIIGKEYFVESMDKGYYTIKSERGYFFFNKKDFEKVKTSRIIKK